MTTTTTTTTTAAASLPPAIRWTTRRGHRAHPPAPRWHPAPPSAPPPLPPRYAAWMQHRPRSLLRAPRQPRHRRWAAAAAAAACAWQGSRGAGRASSERGMARRGPAGCGGRWCRRAREG
eukprot:scaffold45550_cov61-Phaeocystis_antarctica.AAC.2